MLVKGKVKVEDLIENFNKSKTYQIQNLSPNTIKVYQGTDEKKFIKLKTEEFFLFQKGIFDYYIEGDVNGYYVSYWELED